MTTYFISRHSGAIEWIEQLGVEIDHYVGSFDTNIVQMGDNVIGTLPISLIAEVCDRGGTYFHICLELPANLRGSELSAQQMRDCNARLECYTAQKITHSPFLLTGSDKNA